MANHDVNYTWFCFVFLPLSFSSSLKESEKIPLNPSFSPSALPPPPSPPRDYLNYSNNTIINHTKSDWVVTGLELDRDWMGLLLMMI